MLVLRRAGVVLIIAVLALGLGGAFAGAKKKHNQAQAAKERIRAQKAPQTCQAAGSPVFGL